MIRHPWKSPSPGDEIDSPCTRCKEETIHRVVALVEGRVHLVICTRCGSQHRHRPSPLRKKRVPLPSERQARLLARLKKADNARQQKPLQEWHEFKEKTATTQAPLYSREKIYRPGDSLEHPAFGLGFVRRLTGATKMEVVFQYEVKILVMNRRPG